MGSHFSGIATKMQCVLVVLVTVCAATAVNAEKRFIDLGGIADAIGGAIDAANGACDLVRKGCQANIGDVMRLGKRDLEVAKRFLPGLNLDDIGKAIGDAIDAANGACDLIQGGGSGGGSLPGPPPPPGKRSAEKRFIDLGGIADAIGGAIDAANGACDLVRKGR